MAKANAKALTLLAFITITTHLTYSQTQQQDRDQTIRLSTELVLIDVQVANKKTGRPVGDLKKDHFSVYEDGIKQQITHFSQNQLPLSIVLLLDVSGSVRSKSAIRQIRDGALQALQQLKPEDEVALMVFARKAKLIQDFTKDRQLLANQIERIKEKANVGRSTFLNDGIYQAALHLRKSSNPISRRVIIAITDNISNQPFFIGHSNKEVLHELLENGVVVSGIIVNSWFGKIRRITDKSPGIFFWRKLINRGDVEAYADKTGGLILGAKKEELEGKLAQLADHLRTRYTIGYTPTNTKQDGKFRRIKVTISPDIENREGKLAILARRGYYARRADKTMSDQPEKKQ